jgi:hypothetical protein
MTYYRLNLLFSQMQLFMHLLNAIFLLNSIIDKSLSLPFRAYVVCDTTIIEPRLAFVTLLFKRVETVITSSSSLELLVFMDK